MHNEFVGTIQGETTEHLLNAMLEILHDCGFRVTNQRKLILEAIAHQVGWHVHPKAVYSYVKERDDNIGMATVYRTIKMLEDMDLLNKVYMMGKQDTTPSKHGTHYHLICLRCGNIRDINDDMLESLGHKVKENYGFETTQVKMTFYGMCNDCKDMVKK